MNNKIKLKILFIFLISTTIVSGCSNNNPEITVSQLKERIESDTSLVVLDVRTPEELNGSLGKIEGAVNIPLQQLELRINELQPYKTKEIAVICRSGRRSGTAQEILLENGFDAKNVSGGMLEYNK